MTPTRGITVVLQPGHITPRLSLTEIAREVWISTQRSLCMQTYI